MSEKLVREALGGVGSTGTKVSDTPEGIATGTAVVGGRGFQHLDSTTVPFFFTNFPANATKEDLRRLFVGFGKVEEVFIPKKLDRWGKRFGFVKFKEVVDEVELGWRLEEVWLWKSRLKVNMALFERNDKKGEEKKGEAVKSINVKVGGGNNFVNGRSFKGVVVSEVGKEVDTGKEIPCLDFLPSEEMLDFLKKGYVADLFQPYTAGEVQQALFMEGWSNIQVIGMGERQVLLQLKDTCGGVESVRKKNEMWWSLMFKRVRKWYPNMVAASRVVWLNAYGIPLHVWDEPFFKKLGSLFGEFDDFDEETIGRKSFEVARIRVSTARKAIIDEEVGIRVMGAEFLLWVVEDGEGQWCPRRKEGRVILNKTQY